MELLGYYLLGVGLEYYLWMAPAVLLTIWAQAKVKSAYARASRIPARSGLSGAETAQRILDLNDITNVGIEPARSYLGDHYDPRRRMLRLSPDVHDGRSLASLGIAAHEVGHAIQHAQGYAPLAIRNGLVPLASIGSRFAFGLIFVGFLLSMWMDSALGRYAAMAGVGLFGVVVIFQLINLPVEFNASSRARQILLTNGMVTQEEDRVVAKVLSAAAMTYVAATLTALVQFLYFALRLFGNRH